MSKFACPSQALLDALVAVGIIDDPRQVRRVLIDIQGGRSPMVYVEKFGDADYLAQAIVDGFGPDRLVAAPQDVPLETAREAAGS